MVTCQYIPEDKKTLEYVINTSLAYDNEKEKTCLIVPTERNVRKLANYGFKYIDILSLSTVFDTALEFTKPILPQELRSYYLLKAVNGLLDKDKTAIFKNTSEEFFSSFLSFAQSAKNIFAFYRELFSEMVSIEQLSKAGKYTDYENQIIILDKLWNSYINAIHNDNYMDKWEIYNNITLNYNFIKSYNRYIFLINGFLTKYELTFIKNIGEISDVIIIFNYAGKMHSQHKEYEKFFNSSSLKDKNIPLFNRNNMQIYECNSNISQIELITKKAYELHEKHNIPFNKMAVVMPESSCKSYFIKLDVYNIFDVSAGEDATTTRTYTLLNNLLNLYSSSSNVIDINNLIQLLTDSYIQQNEEASTLLNNLYNMQDNSKLYLTKDEVINIDFIKKYFEIFLNMDEKQTIKATINIFKQLLFNIKELLIIEEDIIHDFILSLDKLMIIYKNINEDISSIESSYLILAELSSLSIDLPKKEIAVTGILETRNMDYDVIFIPFMTEDMFPPKSTKDLFINTEIRNHLQLPTYIDRENLMKDYIFQIINHAKLTVFSYAENTNNRRSSFLEELIINYHIPVLYFAPKEISLLHTNPFYYNHKYDDIVINKTDDIIKTLKNMKYSASSLKIYISCSLQFYFKKILYLQPQSQSEYSLNSQIFGIVLHNTLDNLYKQGVSVTDKNYLSLFQKEYINLIKEYHAYKYSNVEQFVSDIVYNNIPKIVEAEVEHAMQGYTVTAREEKIEVTHNNFNLIGYIDKIEEKDNELYVTDYKYKDMKNIDIIATSKDFEKIADIQLPFYALIIKKHMKKLPKELFYFSLKEQFQYVTGFNMDFYDESVELINKILKDIINKDTPFMQTEDTKVCKYCDYASICGRENGFFTK